MHVAFGWRVSWLTLVLLFLFFALSAKSNSCLFQFIWAQQQWHVLDKFRLIRSCAYFTQTLFLNQNLKVHRIYNYLVVDDRRLILSCEIHLYWDICTVSTTFGKGPQQTVVCGTGTHVRAALDNKTAGLKMWAQGGWLALYGLRGTDRLKPDTTH